LSVRVAVASSDGKYINQHFGHAQKFLIFDLEDDGSYKFIETRDNVPTCKGGDHAQSDLEDTFNIIDDVEIVLVSQIGPGAAQFLLSRGIQPYMVTDFIDVALNTISTMLNSEQNNDK
jgi:predicted Fe-Mo cluster-binding NifX family protein